MPDDHLDERLSAYLAGELGTADAMAFEARLREDPALAVRLEALHEALVRLGDLDAVEPPAGYGGRLRARLGEADEVAVAAGERAGGAVADLAGERTRRRQVPWAPLGAVAAGIATLAVIVSVVGPLTAGDGVEVAEAPADAPVAMDAPDADMEALDEQGVDAHAFDDEAVIGRSEPFAEHAEPDRAAAPAPGEAFAPVVVDSEVVLADEAAVREHAADLPEAVGLLGLERGEAEDRAPSARFAVQRSEPFASGVHPAACLDVVSTATDAPVVVARVESAVYAGERSLVYVVATASGGSAEVDRIEVWVVAPDTCATHLFLTLS